MGRFPWIFCVLVSVLDGCVGINTGGDPESSGTVPGTLITKNGSSSDQKTAQQGSFLNTSLATTAPSSTHKRRKPQTTSWATIFDSSYMEHAQSCWTNWTSNYKTLRPCLDHPKHCVWEKVAATDGSLFQRTLYPTTSLSTSRLCDGLPRVDFSPITERSYEYSTIYKRGYWAYPSGQPKGSPPCVPNFQDCALYQFGSNLYNLAAHNLSIGEPLYGACGLELDFGVPCLIQGGPARLLYFPVTTADGDLCKGNGTTITPTDQPSLVTTLGQTFTAGSAYVSFETIYAGYRSVSDVLGGDAVKVGPGFSNVIFTFASSEISTNCYGGGPYTGGSRPGFGPGTQVNFADLNYPHPASAYKCQDQCEDCYADYGHPHEFCTPNVPGHCTTIWNNFNPLLQIPTRLKELVPEWSTCHFWHSRQQNFVLDPPTALQLAQVVATPTLPIAEPSTSAQPSPSITQPPAMTSPTSDPTTTSLQIDPSVQESGTLVQDPPDSQSVDSSGISNGTPVADRLPTSISQQDPSAGTTIAVSQPSIGINGGSSSDTSLSAPTSSVRSSSSSSSGGEDPNNDPASNPSPPSTHASESSQDADPLSISTEQGISSNFPPSSSLAVATGPVSESSQESSATGSPETPPEQTHTAGTDPSGGSTTEVSGAKTTYASSVIGHTDASLTLSGTDIPRSSGSSSSSVTGNIDSTSPSSSVDPSAPNRTDAVGSTQTVPVGSTAMAQRTLIWPLAMCLMLLGWM